MRFDLTDLQLFVNTVETGTITQGAERSHITLASASSRIRGMENLLGTPLLARWARGVMPTAAGQTLLLHARRVLQNMDSLRHEMQAHGGGLQTRIQLFCNTSALLAHLPQLIAPFLQQHSGVDIDLQERGSADIVAAVRDGLCDIGIASDATDIAGVHTQTWRADVLALVMPPGHALLKAAVLGLAQLAGQNCIGMPADSALQQLIATRALRQGVALRYRVRVQQMEAAAQLVVAGVGVAVLPLTAAEHLASRYALAVRPLQESWAQRQLLLCTSSGPGISSAAQALLAHLKNHAEPSP